RPGTAPGPGGAARSGPRPPAGVGDGLSRASMAVIGVLVVVATTLAVWLADPIGSATGTGTTGSPGTAQSGAQTSSVSATGETTEVTVGVQGMAFTPSSIEVPAGNRLVITFENTGDQYHDLVLATGAETGSVAPGASATLDAGVITGDVSGWCSLPGHRQMGMTLQVTAVGGSGSPSSASQGDAAGGAESGNHDMSHMQGATPAGVPSAAELATQAEQSDPHPAELPALEDSTDHHYTFRVTEQQDPVARGLTREVWTYNGTSPGPTLRGRVGDTFHITLVNDGSMGHSIDFHAGDVAPNEPMRTIEPGQTLQYTFTARRSGIWMYHCSTMPMSMHIANGMYGAVVIDPDGLEHADREYVLVGGELYLGSNGDVADAAKIAGLVPDIQTFNGRAFQYDAHPLPARVGEKVRVWVLDAGPNQSLAFHVVGAQFDTVWSEGHAFVVAGTSTDGATRGATGAQVLPLLPAQGGYVEFTPREPGRYAFVNHAMSLAEKGAHGFFEVTQ
ncbi:MAG: multicopper oxidase domain-containing protein, partial [Propionibacterium sp.]|nr:multicopper oxidase domain-containing protein [Propionibacterium sp.]